MSPHATYSAGDAPGHLEHLTREIGTEDTGCPTNKRVQVAPK